MSIERSKVFEFLGKRWRVNKVNALGGSNLIRKFAGSGANNPSEFLAKLSSEEFLEIQKVLFSELTEVQVINEEEVFIPVMTSSGTIGKALSEDASLIFFLTIVCVAFNLSGFFGESALKEFQELVKSFNASNPKI
jgi:hypothetical protein